MQGTPKAIHIQGIVRNATVIGAQDGQAEDLLNLRFIDGSWRASGDGRLINFTMGAEYTQLYVHTNVYHHLLGVNNGTLYWFAEIGTDGTTFYPLDNTTSRTGWPSDMQDLPTAPVALTTVVGDIWITQTGHLLTIIDENDDFEYLVFKTGEKEYIEVKSDANGEASSRSLYPFGEMHFNCYCPMDDDHKVAIDFGDATFESPYHAMDSLLNLCHEKNLFTQHLFAIAAFELYDGSYAYASNPVHICPRENFNYQTGNERVLMFHKHAILIDVQNITEGFPPGVSYDGDVSTYSRIGYVEIHIKTNNGVFQDVTSGATLVDGACPWLFTNFEYATGHSPENIMYGADLVLSVDSSIIDKFDENIFNSLCIFVTAESNIFPSLSAGQNIDSISNKIDKRKEWLYARTSIDKYVNGTFSQTDIINYPLGYFYSGFGEDISWKKKAFVADELLHSPFYLLRRYKKQELYELLDNPIIKINGAQYDGLLKNIVQQKTLPIEALSRTTYLPKVSYMYNGRLHIANYKSYPFFGYPIDLFHLHNHSVKVQANSWFKGVLPNLADNNDSYLQYAKTDYAFTSHPPTGLEYFAYITVKIDSSQGEQTVVRYIPPYDFTTAVNGRADFIESLNPLLTYPDARAKKMTITLYRYQSTGTTPYQIVKSKTFTLKPHPYLNIAYYIDPDLKPIGMGNDSSHGSLTIPAMVNIEEYFPNGLKVSKTDQPMFFPVENAYQVGSAEILALMSNTIAVGTGQTGAAPLYVFCKDGVYALFVDASGQMTYSNSRVLARDVCNNPRSVTPIDAGVVFTTDRGLMMIAGEQVEEIGQPAEGDVLQYVDSTKVDYSKYAFDALTKIAGLPSSLCDTTDFLTYLQDKGTLGKAAIVNYNHNMRELIISNPNYAYSYVLDREGNWSRRDYTAAEYVNNYPTSYRVTSDGKFYKLDDEGDASTSLEHRKEADNQIFYLSNVIKLDSIGFKQAYRFVVRGYFETQTGHNVGIVVEGSYDGIKFAPLGFNRNFGKFTNIGCHVSHTDVRFYRVILCGQVTGKTRIDYMELSADGSKLNTKIR